MSVRSAIFGSAILVAVAPNAFGHSGNPALAFLTTPPTCSTTVAAGELYPIRWLDTDTAIATGTATVNLYATKHIPQTFLQGMLPMGLREDSIVIAEGIREADRANVWRWDTTNVPSGTWFIWSHVDEPAIEMSITITNFSPGTLTVVRPGDPSLPSVMLVKPDTPFRFADNEFVIEWCGRDPGANARVKLEVTPTRNATEFELLADDLPASGTFTWNTRCLYEADRAIKATISTPDGYEHVAFGRYFLFVTHPFGSRDAGGLNEGCISLDDALADGGADDSGNELADTGDGPRVKLPAEEGCNCSATQSSSSGLASLLVIIGAIRVCRRRYCARIREHR